MSEAVLKLKDLSARNNKSKVLWKLSEAELPSRGIVILIGRNGAGKSTLLRIIIGLVRRYKGTVSWNLGQAASARTPLGYVPEFPVVVPGVKAREWIAWYHGMKPSKLLESLPPYFQSSGFSAAHLLDRKLTELSKGELQIVQIWQQFLLPPAAGIFDEPFSGLDPWHKEKLVNAIGSMADHMVLLVSSHEIPQALRARARAIWLIDSDAATLQVIDPSESPI